MSDNDFSDFERPEHYIRFIGESLADDAHGRTDRVRVGSAGRV